MKLRILEVPLNCKTKIFITLFLVAGFLNACVSNGGSPWKDTSFPEAQRPPSVLTTASASNNPGTNIQTRRPAPQQRRIYEFGIDENAEEGYFPTVDQAEDYSQNDPRVQYDQNRFGTFGDTYSDQTYPSQLPNQPDNEIVSQDIQTPNYNTGYRQKAKIALLLPLSGEHKNIGTALLQSAQLALFDLGDQNIELLPRDTKGTPEGARIAAQQALRDGSELVLGPVFANSVKAVKPILSRGNINMIAFSTDWSNAGGNTFIMGVLPFTQVQRVTEYVARQGYFKYGIIAPRTQYGDIVSQSYTDNVRQNGGELVRSERYSPIDPNISPLVRDFADYDLRASLREERVLELEERLEVNPEDEIALQELESLENIRTLGELPFEVVMVPVGGEEAKTLVNLLRFYDVDGEFVQLIGTGLWDDAGLAKEPAMNGAYFAAPSPKAREFFENKYQNVYGHFPPRIASLAYDAAALSIILARGGTANQNIYSKNRLTNPNGFAGIDGIFRLGSNGLVERGLAVLQIQNGSIRVIEPAPTTFQIEDQNRQSAITP